LCTFTLSSHQHSNKQASQQNQHNANKHILHIRCGLWWFRSSYTSHLMYGERSEQGASCCSSCNVVSRLEQPNVPSTCSKMALRVTTNSVDSWYRRTYSVDGWYRGTYSVDSWYRGQCGRLVNRGTQPWTSGQKWL
jgi:hypothetical protein